jgi:hypothetical protein
LIANIYYRDDYIRSVYKREAPGAPPYPEFVEQGAGDAEGDAKRVESHAEPYTPKAESRRIRAGFP